MFIRDDEKCFELYKTKKKHDFTKLIFVSGIHVWDFAAGAVLVSEAGGIVQDLDGQEFDMMSRRILVASTPKLVQDWRDKVDFKYLKKRRDFPDICPM